jgi:hypothetical protein
MTINEIKARLEACPIPADAVTEWKGTNHYYVMSAIHPEHKPFWWIVCRDCLPPERHPLNCLTEEGWRLVTALDYACSYRRDVAFLLARIEQLEAGLRSVRADVTDLAACFDPMQE